MSYRAHVCTKRQIEYGGGQFNSLSRELENFLSHYVDYLECEGDTWTIGRKSLEDAVETMRANSEDGLFIPERLKKEYGSDDLIAVFEEWIEKSDQSHDEIYIDWF